MLRDYFHQQLKRMWTPISQTLKDVFTITIKPVRDHEPPSIANEEQAKTARFIANNFEELFNEFERLRHEMYHTKKNVEKTRDQIELEYSYNTICSKSMYKQYMQILRNYADGAPTSIDHIGSRIQLCVREMRDIMEAPQYSDFIAKLDRFKDDPVKGLAAMPIQGMSETIDEKFASSIIYKRIYEELDLDYREIGLK